jgi:hypothetical protein
MCVSMEFDISLVNILLEVNVWPELEVWRLLRSPNTHRLLTIEWKPRKSRILRDESWIKK